MRHIVVDNQRHIGHVYSSRHDIGGDKHIYLSVSEIGSSVGYVSSAHFSHLFKKMTGVAPSDWRRPEADQSKDLIDLTGLM